MLGSMLRCESLSPRRRARATIATWSFGVLIVGGAIVDATVLRRDPTPQSANVEVQSMPEAQPTLPTPRPASFVVGEAELAVPRWLGAADPRPNNRLDLDGIPYTITHQAGDGIAVELRVADCARGEVKANDARHELVDGRVAAFFPDGTYMLSATCDGTPLATGTASLTVRLDNKR